MGSEIGEVILLFLMVTGLVGFKQLWQFWLQASDGRLTPAPRPPPLPDPRSGPAFPGIMVFLLSLATYLEVDSEDTIRYVGSGFGSYFDWFVIILAVCSLVGSLQLLWFQEQAPDTRRVPAARPPPHPDPARKTISLSSRRLGRKAFLAVLREEYAANRLSRCREGTATAQRCEMARSCWWRIDMVYSLPLAWWIGYMAENSSMQVQWLSVLGIGWLVRRWIAALGDGGLWLCNTLSTTQNGSVTSPDSILDAISNDFGWCMYGFRNVGWWLIQQLVVLSLRFGLHSWVQSLAWSASASQYEALLLTLLAGDVGVSLVRRPTALVNYVVFGFSLCRTELWADPDGMWIWWLWLFWTHVCPPLPSLLHFITTDIPATWCATASDSLARDLDEILSGQEHSEDSEWTNEAEHAQCSVSNRAAPLHSPRQAPVCISSLVTSTTECWFADLLFRAWACIAIQRN